MYQAEGAEGAHAFAVECLQHGIIAGGQRSGFFPHRPLGGSPAGACPDLDVAEARSRQAGTETYQAQASEHPFIVRAGRLPAGQHGPSGGDDQDPAGADGAVLGANWGAAVGVLASPGCAQPGPGSLFLSESRRNLAEPLTLWTWSKVVRRIALAAGVPRFSTHTTRHLCLTDLTRMGWELHAIAGIVLQHCADSGQAYWAGTGWD